MFVFKKKPKEQTIDPNDDNFSVGSFSTTSDQPVYFSRSEMAALNPMLLEEQDADRLRVFEDDTENQLGSPLKAQNRPSPSNTEFLALSEVRGHSNKLHSQSTSNKTGKSSLKLKPMKSNRQSIGHMAIKPNESFSSSEHNQEDDDSDLDDRSTESSVLTTATDFSEMTGPMMKAKTPEANKTKPTQEDDSFEWAYKIWRDKGLLPKAGASQRKPRHSMPALVSSVNLGNDDFVSPRKTRMSMQVQKTVNSRADGGFKNVLKQWQHVSHEQPKTDYLIPSNLTANKTTRKSDSSSQAVNHFRERLRKVERRDKARTSNIHSKTNAPIEDTWQTTSTQATRIRQNFKDIKANGGFSPSSKSRRSSIGSLASSTIASRDTTVAKSVVDDNSAVASKTVASSQLEPLLLSPQKKKMILGDTPIQRKPVNLTPPRNKVVNVHRIDISQSPATAAKDIDAMKGASPWTKQLLSKIQDAQPDEDIPTPRNEARNDHPWKNDAFIHQVQNFSDQVTDSGGCQCSYSTFSGDKTLAEFFLPLMGLACTCGAHQQRALTNIAEPTSLDNILRPWQVDFLANFGIHRGDQLVKAHHRSAGALAKALRQYRRKNGMAPFRTKSCGMALHIWSKTSKSFVRSIRKQLAEGKGDIKVPNTLYIVSAFLDQMNDAGERIREDEEVSPRNNVNVKVA